MIIIDIVEEQNAQPVRPYDRTEQIARKERRGVLSFISRLVKSQPNDPIESARSEWLPEIARTAAPGMDLKRLLK